MQDAFVLVFILKRIIAEGATTSENEIKFTISQAYG
jgi:hypothetical protein